MRDDLAADFEIEAAGLLEVLYRKYHVDFRGYSKASIHRRLRLAMDHFKAPSISILQHRLFREPARFNELLQYLTVPTTSMFRDPEYFLAFREKVVPLLRTYPSFKIWIAGCSTGEEVHSFAILLREERLDESCLVYATDVNPESLRKAESGVFPLASLREYTTNYQRAGGTAAFSDYYTTAYDYAVFDPGLRRNVVFTDHSLATDSVFSEVEFISCRNVLIYFDRELQERAFGLFHDSLSNRGLLGLGSKETLRFSSFAGRFEEFCASEKIYRKLK